ncbi:hypothetical protein KCV01_g9257, partial [Aureobasidium melanogenum]
MDMRDIHLMSIMEGCDAVIHLGFVVAQANLSTEDMRSVNIEGSANVVNAARAAGVRKFINLSSVSVYGSGENMTEATSPAPPSWFPYAHHKLHVERYIEQTLPDAIQFRAHLVIGAKAQEFHRRIFHLPLWLDFGLNPPKQQVVHEDDVVDALIASLQRDVRGFYNLAAPEVIALGGDYIRKGQQEGRRIRRVRFGLVRAFAVLGRRFIKKDLLTLIAMLNTTSTVTCARAASDLGWQPKRSAWDARKDALRSLEGPQPLEPMGD